jgi:muconate cycloisomerase
MSDHKITDITVHIVRIPARAVHSHGSGDVAGVDSAIIEITTDTGITGWGEASPWAVFTGTTEGNAAALHVHLRPHLIGQDPVLVEKHLNMAGKVIVGHNEAKAALEMALLDITGKISGFSVSELVGGRQRDSIPLSYTVANPDFDANLEEIASAWSDGVRILKLKTGFADHSFDIMRLEKLRKLYGDDVSLRIDYNQGLPAYDAIRKIRDLEAFNPAFVEQPVKMHEREALAEITRVIDTPIMADESVFDPYQAFHGAHDRIADIFALKLMKAGGIRNALKVAAIARIAGLEVYGGCMFETGIAHTAGAHLMGCVPDLLLGCEYYQTTYYSQEDILVKTFAATDGTVHVPTAPGLGFEINRDTLKKYTKELLT